MFRTLRSRNLNTRAEAVREVLERHKPDKFYVTVDYFHDKTRLADGSAGSKKEPTHARVSIYNVDDGNSIIRVRVERFGHGKPQVGYGSEGHHYLARRIAKDLGREGWYLFKPLVEQYPSTE